VSAVAFAGAALVGASLLSPATALTAVAHGIPEARFDRPFNGFASPSTVLTDSSPADAGLDPRPIDDALAQIAGWEEPSGTTHPLYAGAVTLLGHDGHVVAREASGYALRYADGVGTELPRDQWVPMRQDTIFDMASVSKLFTSILVMQQIERGAIQLEEPVATYLPAFAAQGKGSITVRQLLTHTSGLKPWMPLWSGWPDKASRIAAVLDVAPTSPPGTTYVYSDLNLITLGVLVERQTGQGLDQLVRERITGPLGMTDTMFNPPASLKPRIAAEEYQPSTGRGIVWGTVHDENAWSLGGIAGNAGVFSTAQDMARARPEHAQRRHLWRPPHPVAKQCPEDDDQLQRRLRRQLPWTGLRAGPTVVHGRPGQPDDRGSHRIHRHLDRHRQHVALVRDRAVQPRSPEPKLGQQQPRPPCSRAGPGARAGCEAATRQHRMVQWNEGRHNGDTDHQDPRGPEQGVVGIRPVRGHGGLRPADPGVLDRRWDDLASGPVHGP